jgi:uncharacterized protein (TIGR02246 family)
MNLTDPSEDSAIAELFDAWADALASRDPARVVALYAPDAILLPTLSSQIRRNKAEITDYFEQFLRRGPLGRVLEGRVRRMGDVAIHAGLYQFTLTAENGRPEVDVRFTFVYQRLEAGWRIVAHHSSFVPDA